MSSPDLNLLLTLNVLLAEGNVARAARRLGLSSSAMSRSLARLRSTMGDPLLVRAGRTLVPTPRALELRDLVAQLVQDAHAVLRPAGAPDLHALRRTFTIRTREGFVANFGPALLARAAEQAPGVRLRFLGKVDRGSGMLREGTVDLETGVVSALMGPEVRAQALFRDRLIGVVRKGHPLPRGQCTAARYAAAQHIVVSPLGQEHDPIDDAMAALGLQRQAGVIVSGFSSALALARGTDLVASVPERHTANLRDGMASFELPFAAPPVTVSMLWHPRMQADPAHRWLRGLFLEVCGARVTPADDRQQT